MPARAWSTTRSDARRAEPPPSAPEPTRGRANSTPRSAARAAARPWSRSRHATTGRCTAARASTRSARAPWRARPRTRDAARSRSKLVGNVPEVVDVVVVRPREAAVRQQVEVLAEGLAEQEPERVHGRKVIRHLGVHAREVHRVQVAEADVEVARVVPDA